VHTNIGLVQLQTHSGVRVATETQAVLVQEHRQAVVLRQQCVRSVKPRLLLAGVHQEHARRCRRRLIGCR